jgi:hypothetical protein
MPTARRASAHTTAAVPTAAPPIAASTTCNTSMSPTTCSLQHDVDHHLPTRSCTPLHDFNPYPLEFQAEPGCRSNRFEPARRLTRAGSRRLEVFNGGFCDQGHQLPAHFTLACCGSSTTYSLRRRASPHVNMGPRLPTYRWPRGILPGSNFLRVFRRFRSPPPHSRSPGCGRVRGATARGRGLQWMHLRSGSPTTCSLHSSILWITNYLLTFF